MQIGDKNVQFNYFAAAQPLASATYLEQVRRIAPPDPPGLISREEELAELARFCLEPDQRPYAWWQADAWAGKSALLSTFVLRPPPQVAGRVRIVSFFITARMAAQDNREAFIQALLEQLAALLGERLPSELPEATRDPSMLNLLRRAAEACRDAGGRLVLVVDGLDEDRGVTTGSDAHSIAGLLPADPPHGMRVVVSGRPNPPVPDDVARWHPLRDPAIIRPLAASPYADDLELLSRRELRRLLRGSPAEQDVLGLLAAARGGLSIRDIMELANIPLWEAEEILQGAAGRTFTLRASLWAPGSGPDAYLLGHEELQAGAIYYLGARLAGYRERLHAWAADYRSKGWPPGTPEYLLVGYYQLLDDTGDLPRMIEFAVDTARHDRMLALTGGNAAALGEVRSALDRIDGYDDLTTALALMRHHDRLASRIAHVPTVLPAVWTALGHVSRARALASTIVDPYGQVIALAGVAETLAGKGRLQEAAATAAQARDAVSLITGPSTGVDAAARVVGALVRTGELREAIVTAVQARDAAGMVADPAAKAVALADVAEMLARAGEHQMAENVARSIASPVHRAAALALVAVTLARAGEHRDAEEVARSVTGLGRRTTGLANAKLTPAEIEQPQETSVQPRNAGGLITDRDRQAAALTGLADVLVGSGQLQEAAAAALQAKDAARSISDRNRRAAALARVAVTLARAGQYQQAKQVARTITRSDRRTAALTDVALTLARAGERHRAEEAARLITNPGRRTAALARVAVALAGVGQYQHAEDVARSISRSGQPTAGFNGAALTPSGKEQLLEATTAEASRAKNAAFRIADPSAKADALARAAMMLVGTGQLQEAATTAAQAEAAAPLMPGGYQPSAVATVAQVLEWALA